MLKNFVKNSFWIAIAFFCAMCTSHAQGVDPTPQNPFATGSALINIGPDADGNLTIGGEYKQPTAVVEQQKPACPNWYADIGYWSQYNFRGTNLTPDSSGAGFMTLDMSWWGFTFGLYGIHQFGTASAPSFSISEGGGGGGAALPGNIILGPVFPETIQNTFNELDVILQYSREFGPIEVTAGNIAFFIQRDAQTFLTFPDALLPQFKGTYGPYPTVENERFDRVYVRLATNKIPYVTPWITYYQTIYSAGDDHTFYSANHIPPNGTTVLFRFDPDADLHERNDRLGGYLEGRLRGHFPITHWLDFNPFGLISFSFHDRSEPIPDAIKLKDIIRGRSLTGWNVAQAGFELPIRVLHLVRATTGLCAPADLNVSLVPFMTYSYHISKPPIGTDRNEVFGGGKVAITF
jgi:hypothetical protein